MRECGLIHAAVLKMGQSGIVVQSALAYLCNRAVGEEQHKVDSEGLLQCCFGGCTEPAQLLCQCNCVIWARAHLSLCVGISMQSSPSAWGHFA